MRGRAARALALLAGLGAGTVLYGLAFPPFGQAWTAWVALVPLLLAIRTLSAWRLVVYAGAYGIACGYGVSYWLVLTLTRFFELPLAAGIAGATFYGVLFWAPPFALFAAGAARLSRTSRPLLAALATAALWVATELLRGRVLGQPWALLGYSQHAHTALIQVAALTAVYGVSFLLALGNVAVANAIAPMGGRAAAAGRLAPLAAAAGLTATAWLGGQLVLRERLPVPSRSVAIVQTNLPPAVRWTRAYTERQLLEHARATGTLADRDDDLALVVWPENAVPRYLELEPGIAALVAGLAQRLDADLLFGSPRHEDGRSYNSVRLITAAGRNGGHYDKQRLVLLAETNPFHPASQEAPSESPTQFAAGRGPGVLDGFVPVGVSICHEVLFPELAANAVRAGAALLVSVSNDGWLDAGHGVAGRQHFAMATLRAVETRRYLVRAATTGISGVIDPFGRLVDSLDLDTSGTLVAPVAGRTGLTPYVRLGDAFALGCLVAALAALWWLPAAPRGG